MGFMIPIIKRDSTELALEWKDWYYNSFLTNEKLQKRMVLVVVSIALLLDNMLYMVIVPIIPKYLKDIGAYDIEYEGSDYTGKDGKMHHNNTGGEKTYVGEPEKLGFLFASKAMVQIFVNPFSGTIIDRIGYEIPMVIGLCIMFCSTAVFALGESYGVLFFARSLQGVGSAFADTAGLAMIADRFQEEGERSKALGIALAFISFGCLVAPPFGATLYTWFGKPVPFFLLSLVCLIDGFMVFMIVNPKIRKNDHGEKLQGTPIWRLFMDPYIAICSGALIMANVSLAFLEPTIGDWMQKTMEATPNEIGMIWLPAFFPHVFGVYLTVLLMKKYPQHPWLLAAIGLALEGASCFIVPLARSFWVLSIPLSGICLGIALIDTSLLPLLGYLVDTRHVSVYGSVYAIADISYSLAYAFGPIIAGEVVGSMGFFELNLGICLTNLLYAPTLVLLRSVYQYKPFESDEMQINDGGELLQNQTSLDYDESAAFGRQKTYGAVGENGVYKDETLKDDKSYGYGSGGYEGGFGVGQLPARYRGDDPQPEYPPGGAPHYEEQGVVYNDNDAASGRRSYQRGGYSDLDHQ